MPCSFMLYAVVCLCVIMCMYVLCLVEGGFASFWELGPFGVLWRALRCCVLRECFHPLGATSCCCVRVHGLKWVGVGLLMWAVVVAMRAVAFFRVFRRKKIGGVHFFWCILAEVAKWVADSSPLSGPWDCRGRTFRGCPCWVCRSCPPASRGSPPWCYWPLPTRPCPICGTPGSCAPRETPLKAETK